VDEMRAKAKRKKLEQELGRTFWTRNGKIAKGMNPQVAEYLFQT